MPTITNDRKTIELVAHDTPQALTNSYVQLGDDILAADVWDQFQLDLIISLDTATSAEVKIEFSSDGTNWFQETFQSISGAVRTLELGENQFNGDGNYRLAIPILAKMMRVSAKATGTVGAAEISCRAIVGVVA